jgi:hypothetical protein
MNYAYRHKNKILQLAVVLAFVFTCELARAAVHADFNGDGYDDLVIGANGEDLPNLPDAGAIHVVYGSSYWGDNPFDQYWHQNSDGVLDAASQDEDFGRALAAGDFNNDGYDDLAVGVPGDDWVNPLTLTSYDKAGGVNVFYGSPAGLTSANDQFWDQSSQGIQDNVETDDRFGSALAAGDFDNDGFDDLAIGVPREDIDGESDAGAVNILYGAPNGLTNTANQFWYQGSTSVISDPKAGDKFGSKLAAGDFDSDGFDDLAVGVSSENINNKEDAGAVNIFYGSALGLTAADDQFWHEDNLLANASEYDYFGSSLTVGNFNGDAFDDLAIGIPYKDTTSALTNVGAVRVLYGSSVGLSPYGSQLWKQDITGFPDSWNSTFGSQNKDDIFGWILAAGDFNNDGKDDLAIGVPGEDYLVGSVTPIETGAVNVIYGSAYGLVEVGKQFWNQDNDGVAGYGQDYDWYGAALATGDYNNDGFDDLTIGIPFEDPYYHGTHQNAGEVHARFGSQSGICYSKAPGCIPAKVFDQSILETPEPGDTLGLTLD